MNAATNRNKARKRGAAMHFHVYICRGKPGQGGSNGPVSGKLVPENVYNCPF